MNMTPIASEKVKAFLFGDNGQTGVDGTRPGQRYRYPLVHARLQIADDNAIRAVRACNKLALTLAAARLRLAHAVQERARSLQRTHKPSLQEGGKRI